MNMFGYLYLYHTHVIKFTAKNNCTLPLSMNLHKCISNVHELSAKISGLDRDLNPGPLTPKARIIPLDHQATSDCNIW